MSIRDRPNKVRCTSGLRLQAHRGHSLGVVRMADDGTDYSFTVCNGRMGASDSFPAAQVCNLSVRANIWAESSGVRLTTVRRVRRYTVARRNDRSVRCTPASHEY